MLPRILFKSLPLEGQPVAEGLAKRQGLTDEVAKELC